MINVLCIEDLLSVADYISALLDNKKYSVNIISDGQQALDFLLSTTKPPDIILLDYFLPSLNGLQILKELKAHKKDYAIVFLTVDETLETAVAAMKEGAIDYLAKSANLKTELNIKIEKAYQIHQERLKKDYYEQQLSTLSLAIEQSPNSIVMTDIHGNIEFINSQFSLCTGYTFDEVKGKNPRVLKTENYPPGFYERLWQTITSGRTWKGEFVNRKKNGELYYEKAVISPVKNKSGTTISYLGIKEDITEHKLKEQALRESEDRFRSIFEMANAGIFVANRNGQITMVNKAFQDMVEYNAKELHHMDFSQFTHPDDLNQENELLKDLVFNEIKQYRIEKRYVSQSGKIIWADLAVAAIHNDEDKPVSYVGVINNISERKKHEQQLKDIIAAKDKFFSIISHDLRNQFSSLLGLTEILVEKKSKLPELDKNKFISLLHLNAESAFALLEDLLKWSRSQINSLELVPEKINLHEMVKEVRTVVQNQASLKRVEIINHISETHEIMADKHMLSTVLRNLINNAVKFTPAGGLIVISSKTENNYDIISVKDNGVGMTAEVAQKIFRIDAKHSTSGTEKEKGTGLGLILCKEFIDKHGGEIRVESEVKKGSEFIIKLPNRL